MSEKRGFGNFITLLNLDSKISRISRHRRSQTTIFIILAIVILIGIFVGFYLARNDVQIEEPELKNPKDYIDKCARDTVKEAVESILKNGGDSDSDLFVMYHGENYTYLCYQKEYYAPCVNQQPLLKKFVEEELEKITEDDIGNCFDSLKEDLAQKGYIVSDDELKYELEIAYENVLIDIRKKVRISKGDSKNEFEEFDSKVYSGLYGLLDNAREVVNQESKFCYFDNLGFMILYPKYRIEKVSYEDSRIYSIKYRETGEEFKFAVRSCVMPPGLA